VTHASARRRSDPNFAALLERLDATLAWPALHQIATQKYKSDGPGTSTPMRLRCAVDGVRPCELLRAEQGADSSADEAQDSRGHGAGQIKVVAVAHVDAAIRRRDAHDHADERTLVRSRVRAPRHTRNLDDIGSRDTFDDLSEIGHLPAGHKYALGRQLYVLLKKECCARPRSSEVLRVLPCDAPQHIRDLLA